ncbi:hypothetical protein D6764_04845, partial [Candidatus Woesearchaeota archaeon]
KKSVKRVLSENWPDIIAVIPVSSLFFVAKVSRVARIFKISKVSKISSAALSAKFLSQDSGFNEALSDKKAHKGRRRKKQ